MELVSPERAGSISNQIMAVERQDATGDDQYVLRVVIMVIIIFRQVTPTIWILMLRGKCVLLHVYAGC